MSGTKIEIKTLIIRLGSLGDVVLASSVFDHLPNNAHVDWVIKEEFAELLRGDLRLNRVWEFERGSGLVGWLKLCRKLWENNYDQVIDLHLNYRSRILRIAFWWFSLFSDHKHDWKSITRSRWRTRGLYLFKSRWPRKWHPKPWLKIHAEAAGAFNAGQPNLVHLLNTLQPTDIPQGDYYCLMPSAQWPGKRWPVEKFCELARAMNSKVVILGTNRDRASAELLEKLNGASFEVISGVGKWNIAQVAHVLARAKFLVGNDTGLGHLAESLGTSVHTIFGPTVTEMGFGPWRASSHTYGSSLWCRPCGKDGRYCFRLHDRFACLRLLDSTEVSRRILEEATFGN